MMAGSYQPGMEQDATTASASGIRGAPVRPNITRCPVSKSTATIQVRPSAQDSGDDSTGPGGPWRWPAKVFRAATVACRASCRPRPRGSQADAPTPGWMVRGARSVVSISRGEPGPQVRPRWMRALVQVAQAGLAERGHRLAALQGGYLVQGDSAAQGGREHAARAGADDQVNVADRDGQALLHGMQGAGHPGGAHHPAGPEHHPGTRTGPGPGGLTPAAPHPAAPAP